MDEIPQVLPGNNGLVVSCASHDGKVATLFAYRLNDQAITQFIVLWDVEKKTVIRSYPIDWQSLPEAFAREHQLAGVGQVAVAPGGRGFLFRDGSKKLVLWKNLETAPTPVLLGEASGRGWLSKPAFTPDGRFVVDVGPTTRVWDSATGRLVRQFPGPPGITNNWAISPDGKRLAIIWGTKFPFGDGELADYRVSLWDFADGKEERRLIDQLTCRKATAPEQLHILFSPDGETVVTLDNDFSTSTIPVRRWQIGDGKAASVWQMPQVWGSGHVPVISRDGKTLCYVSEPGIRTYDLATGAERTPEEIREPGHRLLGLMAEERVIVTLNGSKRVCLWDAETGRRVREERPLGEWSDIAFDWHAAPDSLLVAVDQEMEPDKNRGIAVVERISGKEIYRLRGEVCGVFAPRGKRLLTLSADYETVHIHDAATGKLLKLVPSVGNDSFFFSPDGRAFGRPMRPQAFDIETGAAIFDATKWLTGHIKPDPRGMRDEGELREPRQYDSLCSLAVGPGARRFAVTAVRYWDAANRPSKDRILMFDATDGKWLWEATPELGGQLGLQGGSTTFSPDGSTLAVAGPRAVLLFDAESGRQLRVFESKGVYDLRYTRDSQRLIVTNADGTIVVWDASTAFK